MFPVDCDCLLPKQADTYGQAGTDKYQLPQMSYDVPLLRNSSAKKLRNITFIASLSAQIAAMNLRT